MHFNVGAVIFFLFSIGSLNAFDPFQGFPGFNCFKPRNISGCKETLLQAYKRSELSKQDQNVNEADTKMYLFTRRNKDNPEFLHDCGGRLPSNTHYREGRKTVFFVLGLLVSVCNIATPREYVHQLLCRDDYNVILVDWTWGNGADLYSGSLNARVVGRQICFVTKNIIQRTGDDPANFHYIGHTLGAHIVGFAGKCMGGAIGRITGLDPDGFGFEYANPEDRLDKSDAATVDVIHCNAGECSLLALKLGIKKAIGTFDFYVNGGSLQPSCIPYILVALLKGDIFGATFHLLGPFCSHYQCLQYFLVSINPCGCEFTGVQCGSYGEFKSGPCRSCGENGTNCAVMGMNLDRHPATPGKYFVDTGILCPYCDNRGIDTRGFPAARGNRTQCCRSSYPSS